MDLLKKIDSLFSGNRGLEQNIERSMQSTLSTSAEIEEYRRSLYSHIETAVEHQVAGQRLMILICRELRIIDWELQQSTPIVGIDHHQEITTIHNVKNILVSRFHDIAKLVERMDKRIIFLQQALDIQGKRKDLHVP